MTTRGPRVLLVTAEEAQAVGGNQTTLRRIEASLRERGLELEVARTCEVGVEGVVARARALAPELVHAVHARHAGPAALAAARAVGAPLVVSSGGTDLDEDLGDPARLAIVREVLAGARVLLVTHAQARQRALALGLPVRVLRVPKGVARPPGKTVPDPARFGAAPGQVLFALPAGVRPVKNNLFPLAPLARLHAEGLPVRLVLAGPVRDEAYGRALEAGLAGHPNASWVGTLEGDALEALYACADVVLNVSHAEGGANAVLEAMVRGCAVLASAIPGNACFLEGAPGRPAAGLLYRVEPSEDPHAPHHDARDFLRRARELAQSPVLRATLGERARARALAEHTPEAEAEGILVGYRLVRADPPALGAPR